MKGRYRKRLSRILGTPYIEHTTNPTPYLKRQHLGSRAGSKVAEKTCLRDGGVRVRGWELRGRGWGWHLGKPTSPRAVSLLRLGDLK